MTSIDETVAAIRSRYDRCFGCGRDNDLGLGLDGFRRAGDGIAATFRPRPQHVGFEGVLHGGIVATALDEIMAWTAMLAAGVYVVTGTLELRYRKPAPTAARFSLAGRIEAHRGRRLRLSGVMNDDDGPVAEGAGLFIATGTVAGA